MKKLLKLIKALIPSRLPQGVSEFHIWADEFIELYDLPTKDVDSIKFVLATVIMHLGEQTAYKPLFYFYLTICAGASKQVASNIFCEIKIKQQEEAAKASEAAKLEVVPSDGSQQ